MSTTQEWTFAFEIKQNSMKSLFKLASCSIFLLALASCSQQNGNLSALQVCQDPSIEKTILSINPSEGQMVTYQHDNADDSWLITTTGNDARSHTIPLGYYRSLPTKHCVLTFDYQTSTGVRQPQFFFVERVKRQDTIVDKISEANSTRNDIHDLDTTKNGEWRTLRLVIHDYRKKTGWANTPKDSVSYFLALDWGNEEGKSIRIRNLCITERNDEENEILRRQYELIEQKRQMSSRIDKYLNASYPSKVTQVTVTGDSVFITGKSTQSGCLIAEVMPHEDITEISNFTNACEIQKGDFSVALPRYVAERDSFGYDRLLSRWVIVKGSGSKQKPLSHARYADSVQAVTSPPAVAPRNKKGILGMAISRFSGAYDIEDLGCGSESNTINLLEWLMTTPKETQIYGQNIPAIPLNYGGRTYYVSGAKVMEFDELFRAYNKYGMLLSVYIELGQPYTATDPAIIPILMHPERSQGVQYMPNLTSFEGINAYAAIIDFLTRHYSEEENGRVHHWCIHNEVNAGKIWCNMGNDVSEAIFTDTYVKSMRLVYNILRQYDQNASVFACFEHCWAKKTISGADYPSKNMLDRIVKYSKAEGDFWWGVGFHPYSIRMKNPAFWEEYGSAENAKNITFSQNTPYITPLNLDVLCQWLRKKENLYKGKTLRICHLNEQGFVSPSYSNSDLQLQAAAAAYLWKKVITLDEIQCVQWYAWNDSKSQVLLLGLRKPHTDNPETNYERKPAWYVWQAAATEREDKVFKPYLKIIGISSWDQMPRP